VLIGSESVRILPVGPPPQPKPIEKIQPHRATNIARRKGKWQRLMINQHQDDPAETTQRRSLLPRAVARRINKWVGLPVSWRRRIHHPFTRHTALSVRTDTGHVLLVQKTCEHLARDAPAFRHSCQSDSEPKGLFTPFFSRF